MLVQFEKPFFFCPCNIASVFRSFVHSKEKIYYAAAWDMQRGLDEFKVGNIGLNVADGVVYPHNHLRDT
jgi:hypothetical protein